MGFLDVGRGGLGSGLELPPLVSNPGALGPSSLFPQVLSLLLCAVRTLHWCWASLSLSSPWFTSKNP